MPHPQVMPLVCLRGVAAVKHPYLSQFSTNSNDLKRGMEPMSRAFMPCQALSRTWAAATLARVRLQGVWSRAE
jgi:hypothetical protein